jgi:hypothetical protein
MNTIEKQTTGTEVAHDDINQAGKVGLAAVTALGGLVGAWGMACMIGALASGGVTGIVSGFLTAVTGM